jgi:hypothetical protein
MLKISKIIRILMTFLCVFSISKSVWANDWKVKSDEDSEGPRCVFWAYSKNQNDFVSFKNSRIVHFTVLSISPLLTEFAYKLPKSIFAPENIRVVTKQHGYPLKYQDGYAWTYSQNADASLLKEILSENEFEVRFTLNGKEINDKYSIRQVPQLLKDLAEKCKMHL